MYRRNIEEIEIKCRKFQYIIVDLKSWDKGYVRF